MLFVCGCAPQEKDPIADIKFTDIRPMYKQVEQPFELTAEIAVFTIEVPVDNYPAFTTIWESLPLEPVTFANRAAFEENGLLVGFGNSSFLPKIENVMLTTNARRAASNYIMVSLELDNELFTSKLTATEELFYYTAKGQVAGLTLTFGKAGFIFDINKIPAAKGIIELIVKPFYEPLRGNRKIFRHIVFQADLVPGDFVLLGPADFQPLPNTFKGLLFANPGKVPTVKVYIMVCRGISD